MAAVSAAERVATHPVHVLLSGETGTGKGLLARLIHARSGRAGGLVEVHCPNLQEGLAESQLFGHVRGAFTSASQDHDGLILDAHRGTLFLDEIGELPLAVQAKLLNVLQELRLRRVGDRREREVDLRAICATHRDLDRMTFEGQFRRDLFTRVVRYRIVVPPLRERGKDVVLLGRHILAHDPALAGVERPRLTRTAERVLLVYSWPGNVRELESVLIQAGIDAQGRAITDRALEAAILAVGVGAAPRLTESARLPELPPKAPPEPRSEPRAKARRQDGRRPAPSEAECLETAKLVHPLGPVALRLAQERGRIQRADLLDATRTSERTADRVLLGLIEAGVLVRDGRAGRAGGYVPLLQRQGR